MTAQFTKHFYERMEDIMDEGLIEYPKQTDRQIMEWARGRMDRISSSVTIDDIEKARDTITKTILYAGEWAMYRGAVAVNHRLIAIEAALRERDNAEPHEHVLGAPPVVETAPDPEQDWLYLYNGRSQWIQIGSSDPANISGGSREIHLGNVRLHTDGRKLIAVEIMDGVEG